MIFFLTVVPPLTTTVFSDSAEPFLLWNSLNPIMIPFLESVGGGCHETMILVEVLEATLKLTGAWEGTVTNHSLLVLVVCKQQRYQFPLNTFDLQ